MFASVIQFFFAMTWDWVNYQRYLTSNLYIFYEVANSYDLTRTILYDLSKPQWRVGLGAGLGVGYSYKFIRIGNS